MTSRVGPQQLAYEIQLLLPPWSTEQNLFTTSGPGYISLSAFMLSSMDFLCMHLYHILLCNGLRM